mgnify:CR=1 FL=1
MINKYEQLIKLMEENEELAHIDFDEYLEVKKELEYEMYKYLDECLDEDNL